MNSSLTPLVAKNLSHEQRSSSFEEAKQTLVNKIQNRGDLPHVSVNRQLELLDQLSEFDLGRFLIERGGIDGYWTHYVVTHPIQGRLTHLNRQGNPFHPLEAFLLNAAPISLATQERFSLFKTQIQQHVGEGCCFASIPSGLMGDLLDLDYSAIHTFTLQGIDLDPETLLQAKSDAEEKGLLAHCHFFQKDAWDLNIHEQFDLITSHGLSIYEPDDAKVTDLYREFYNALKPGGILVASFVTHPPAPGLTTEWDLSHVNTQDALLQKILCVDILEGNWQTFRTEATVRSQLHNAGFIEIEVFYDKAHIFPTMTAKKIMI